MEPVRYLFDNHVGDWLDDHRHHLDVVKEAVHTETVVVFVSAVVLDEMAATPNDKPGDPGKRDRLAQVLQDIRAVRVPDAAGAWKTSRWGHAVWTDGARGERIDAIDSPNRGHRKDAIIAVTSEVRGARLVTRDRRLTNAALRNGIPVVRPDAFIDEVRGLVVPRRREVTEESG